MNRVFYLLVVLSLAAVGCSETEVAGSSQGDTTAPKAASGGGEQAPAADAEQKAATTEVALSPENTKVEFVCNHTGDDPRPREGGFKQFSGSAAVADSGLESLQVEIETASVYTEIEKLTNHLKSPDFFDVRQHPKATFQSTSIELAGDGKVNITGDLTLLGNTQSIAFPATVSTDDGLSVDSTFTIDRAQFGMDYGQDNVENEVKVTVSVDG